MFGFVAKKVTSLKKSIWGVFQHSGAKNKRPDDIVHTTPPVNEQVPEGTHIKVLNGRDAPVRPRSAPQEDLTGELEVTGFLDQFKPHPLQIKPESESDK